MTDQLTSALKLADAKEDFDHWKETRRGYLTSSEIYGYREVDVPDWYASNNNPKVILAGKRGEDKEFDEITETTMLHGNLYEERVQENFGWAVGCEVLPDNGLYWNPKWSRIAASIDGFGQPGCPSHLFGVHPEVSQDRSWVEPLRDEIDRRGTLFLTEVKFSTSQAWPKGPAQYYKDQVQTQLHVLDMPYAVIMAQTFMRHPDQKWRFVWDFRAHIIEFDPAWAAVLDETNAAFDRACPVVL